MPAANRPWCGRCASTATTPAPSARSTATPPTLWKQFDVPRVLIYLDSTLEVQQQRRPDVTWDAGNLAAERQLLQNARAEADLRLNTAQLSGADVLHLALAYLRAKRIRHAPAPLPPPGETGAPVKGKIRL